MIDTLTTSWRRAGTLRSGLTAKEAADRLWLLTTVEYHLAAVDRLGWTPQAHERWLVEVAERELLEPASESEG